MTALDPTPTLRTNVAHAGFDDHAFCGHRVFEQLAGRTSTAGIFALALTGRRLSQEDCAVIDDLIVCATMADPRIWPLKVARILGSYGGSLPGLAAGHLAMDGAIVGPSATGAAARQLLALRRQADGRVDDLDAVQRALQLLREHTPRPVGFGVPFRPRDERLEALRRCMVARQRQHGPYWTLLESVIAISRRGAKKFEPNYMSAIAAVGLDLGFEPELVATLGVIVVSPCFHANVREATREPAAALRKLPESAVEYMGVARRTSPRAAGR